MADFPFRVWDGLSENRDSRLWSGRPDYRDWNRLVDEVIAMQRFLLGAQPPIVTALDLVQVVTAAVCRYVDSEINLQQTVTRAVARPASSTLALTQAVEVQVRMNLGVATVKTVAAGVITIDHSYHRVDTEGAAVSDDLDFILGGNHGDLLILSSVDAGRDVRLRDNIGNLRLPGNFTLTNPDDTVTLLFNGANWVLVASSNNG